MRPQQIQACTMKQHHPQDHWQSLKAHCHPQSWQCHNLCHLSLPHTQAALGGITLTMEYEEDGDEDNINQEDCWEVISAYFEEKGLVRQQVLAAELKSLP